MNILRIAALCSFLLMLWGCAPQSDHLLDPGDARTHQPHASETIVETPPIPSADSGLPVDEKLPPETEIVVQEELDSEDIQAELSPEEESALQSEPEIEFTLDLVETKEMETYFVYYTHRYRNSFEKWLERAEPYLPYIKEHFTSRGLPLDLIYLPFAESGFNPWAYSHAGAAGLWQFMPYTGRKYGLQVDWWTDERRDPYMATKAAADYLEKLYGDFNDWYLALAAYNAGEGRVGRALSKSGYDNYFDLTKSHRYLKKETRHYVPKFMAILKIIRNLEELGFDPLESTGPAPTMLEVPAGTDLLALANACSISWNDFRHQNPAFRRMVSPPDRTSRIYLPQEKLTLAQNYLNSSKAKQYAGYFRHKVRSGESWWIISRRHSVPITVLKKLNNKRSNLLRPGEYVLVPGHSTQVASSSLEKTRKLARQRANYTVEKGDTLWDISRMSGVSVTTLLRANGLTSSRSLQIGQKLYIPHPNEPAKRVSAGSRTSNASGSSLVEYRVQRGDTLWDIARRFGVSHKDLQAWNSLGRSAYIRPGDNLKVYTP